MWHTLSTKRSKDQNSGNRTETGSDSGEGRTVKACSRRLKGGRGGKRKAGKRKAVKGRS